MMKKNLAKAAVSLAPSIKKRWLEIIQCLAQMERRT